MKKGEIMNEIVLKVPASLRLMSLVRSTIKNYLEIRLQENWNAMVSHNEILFAFKQ